MCSFLLYSKVIQLSVCVCVYMYIYIYTFLYSFPLWFITGYWIEFPVLYNRNWLFIHPLYNSLHLSQTPNPFLPHPTHLGNQRFRMSVSLFLCHRYVHLCCTLDSTYRWYHVFEWSFWSLKSELPLIKRDKRNICSFSLSTLLSMWRDGK